VVLRRRGQPARPRRRHPRGGDHTVFNGRKTFSTGSQVSDVTVLEGVLELYGDVANKPWAVEAPADQVAQEGRALHEPVAYERREVAVHLLTGELPEPTWHS
jgi:hypothetical protein